MVRHRPGDKPFSEPLLVRLSMHILVTQPQHHSDIIMSAVPSQITSVSIVYSTVCSGTDQRKHQSSASLAFVRVIHQWPVNSLHKGPVTRKMLLFDDIIVNEMLHYNDVIMSQLVSQITSLTIVYSTVYSRADQRKKSKLHVTGLCARNSPGTGEFPAQMASNMENVSIWWRHHGSPGWHTSFSVLIPLILN